MCVCARVCACACMRVCVCVYVSVGVAVLLKDRDGLGEIACIVQFMFKRIAQMAKHNGVLICACVYLSVGVPVHLKDRDGFGEIVCIMEFIYKHINQNSTFVFDLLVDRVAMLDLLVCMYAWEVMKKKHFFILELLSFMYVCMNMYVCMLCMYVSSDLCRFFFLKEMNVFNTVFCCTGSGTSGSSSSEKEIAE